MKTSNINWISGIKKHESKTGLIFVCAIFKLFPIILFQLKSIFEINTLEITTRETNSSINSNNVFNAFNNDKWLGFLSFQKNAASNTQNTEYVKTTTENAVIFCDKKLRDNIF